MNRRLVLGIAAVVLMPTTTCLGPPMLLIGVLLVDATFSTSVETAVVGKRWIRSVAVERWDQVERTERCSQVPEGVEVIRRTSGSTSHRRRKRSSPRCTYRILGWAPDEPRIAEGTDIEPRVWPDAPAPDACPDPTIGCLRGSTQTETLLLDLEGVACPVAEPVWSAHRVGDRVVLRTSLVFRRPLCEELE
jgi:hypothetical protein